jgi:hypothetical protein
MGRRNRELVADEYSWSTTAARLASLYRSLVAGTDDARTGGDLPDDPGVATDGASTAPRNAGGAAPGGADETAVARSAADPTRNGADGPVEEPPAVTPSRTNRWATPNRTLLAIRRS